MISNIKTNLLSEPALTDSQIGKLEIIQIFDGYIF